MALQSGIALFLAVSSFIYLPQSPRWLAYKGRKAEASLAWDKLGVSSAEREKDLLQNPAMEDDVAMIPSEGTKAGFLENTRAKLRAAVEVFGKDTRKPLLLGVFMMSMQQLSGIDGVIYVCSKLFPLLLYVLDNTCSSSIADLQAVRTTPLPAGRSHHHRSYVPCVWRFRNPYLRLYDYRRRFRRPLGAPPDYNLWWPSHVRMYGSHGHALCHG